MLKACGLTLAPRGLRLASHGLQLAACSLRLDACGLNLCLHLRLVLDQEACGLSLAAWGPDQAHAPLAPSRLAR
jgi:hypothetical protein